jgi:ATP-dependent DNA helicase Q4
LHLHPQLQIIFNTLKSLAFPKYLACSTFDLPVVKSDSLKQIIRNYFQSDLPMDVVVIDESNDTADGEILSDIRQTISMYPDNTFSGRALARLFHGISSPCYPAVIWGRCKYWRAHMNVNFSRLVSLGNLELVRMRRVD